MHQPLYKRRWVRRSALLLLLLLIGFGTYLAVRPYLKMRKVRQLQAEFASTEARNWTPDQRRAKFQEMQTAMQGLSARQREDLAEERQKREENELRRYSQMSPAEKARYLDERIDRMEGMRRQFAPRNANAQSQRPPRTGQGTFKAGSQGPRHRSSAEEREKRRKERLNRTTPEYRALRDMFRKDMETRRKQRGFK